MVKEIYNTLPENPVVPQELKDSILRFLKQEPNKYFNVKQISEATNYEDKDKTQPTIRKACKELLHFQHEPIASCHAGFTYATHQGIMKHFKADIQSRVQGLLRTLNDIDKVIELLPDIMSGEAVLSVKSGFCGGVYETHRWAETKKGTVCIRCGAIKQ